MGINIGNKNKIENANFIEKTEIKLEEKPKDGFWKQVLVNIMSNFLWKVLSILATLAIIVGGLLLFNNH